MQSRFTASLIASLMFAAPAVLQATDYSPNVFDDPAPVAAPNGCSNGGRCSLREAVLSATASDGTNTIILGEGTYQLTIPEAGNAQSGDLDFNGTSYSITIQGQGPDKTKIQASAGLNSRIIEILGTSVNMTLQGITFEGGKDGSGTGGGALRYSIGGSTANAFNILNCNFLNNTSDSSGGAVYLSSGNPTVNVDGGTYSGNTAVDFGGGLFLSHGGAATELDSVKNIVLTGNKADQGAGMMQSAGKGISISNIQATGNTANTFAGGLFIGNGGSPLGLELKDSVISDNTVTNGDGGGLVFSSGGLVKIANSTFSGNEAQGTGEGGGAEMGNGGGIQILGSTFSGNKAAGTGGGIHYTGSGGTLHEITNSTISGNEAGAAGGGGISTDHTFSISFNNVTIADNTTTGVGGGASVVTQPVILRNTIFSGNDSAGSSDDCIGLFTSEGFNIFGSPNDGDCEPDGAEVGDNPDDIVGNAMIGPLADNGGPTLTHALLLGSPAINGGDPSGCIDGRGAFLTVDQRGAVRPAGAECDIGAFESAVADLAIVKTSNSQTYIQGDEITYTLTVTNNGPDASTALIEDVLPSQVTFISAAAGCTNNGGTVTCDLGTLDSGESATVEIVAEASGTGDIDNTATVSGSDIDTDPSNDSSTASAVILVQPEDNGGCRLGSSGQGSPVAWSLLGLGLGGIALFRRRGWE